MFALSIGWALACEVEDENLETCISPASARPLFALGLMSQFKFWRCPWKITARADHVGGALLTARATGHCHLPRLKISTEALRHAAYSRSLDNGIPVGVLDSMGAISRLCHFAQRCDIDGLPPLEYASG